jgi:plasmid maintenance system antidote protein VapI
MIRSIRAFPEDVIHKIAPILEISPETIKGWILVGKYPENILKMAFKVKQEMPKKKGMLILTRKIDEILGQKGVSRTGASTIIGYRQGKLNEMIIGKKPMSPLVISKLAPFLEVSEEQIRAWIVADKYSLEALQAANM